MGNLIKGDTLTVGIAFASDYDPSRIEDIAVAINGKRVGRLSDDTIEATANPRLFLLKLTSSITRQYSGDALFTVAVTDEELRVKHTPPITVPFAYSPYASIDATKSNVTDITINIEIEDAGLVVNVTLATIYRGASAYEIAVQNGFVGTELEWLESLKSNSVFVAVSNLADGQTITHGLGGIVKAYFYGLDNIEDETVRFKYNNDNSVIADLPFLNEITGLTLSGTIYFLKISSNKVVLINASHNQVITHGMNGVVKGFFFDETNNEDTSVRFEYVSPTSVRLILPVLDGITGATISGSAIFVKLK